MKKLDPLNDGFLEYGHKTVVRSENRKKIGEQFVSEGTLAFTEMSARESDYQMVGFLNSQLDMKVKTMFPPSFKNINKNKLKVMIRGIEYDVIRVDPDNVNSYLYFYLQEVGGYSE